MQTGKNPGIAAHLPELISEFISLDDREAERRETFGCQRAPVGGAVSRHARRLRGALRPMTRDARLSALHRGGFGPRGRASVSLGARRPTTAGSCLPDPCSELLAARS